MDKLFKNGLGLVDLELGLELGHVGEAAAVGAATGVGETKVFVDDVIAKAAPIASTRSVLLDLLGVHVGMTAFGKETREMLRGVSGAVGEALVVTVIGFVRAGHFGGGA